MVRVDKWLWAARFFKTRTAAQEAIAAGRVRLGGERIKPGRELKVGDSLDLRLESGDWLICVQRLSERRGPATEARTLYEEDADSARQRAEALALRKLTREPAAGLAGRPTKRQRRDLDRWRGS